MSNHPILSKAKSLSRRQILKWGLAGAEVTSGAIALRSFTSNSTPSVRIPPIPEEESFNQMKLLRDFDYGTIKQENAIKIR